MMNIQKILEILKMMKLTENLCFFSGDGQIYFETLDSDHLRHKETYSALLAGLVQTTTSLTQKFSDLQSNEDEASRELELSIRKGESGLILTPLCSVDKIGSLFVARIYQASLNPAKIKFKIAQIKAEFTKLSRTHESELQTGNQYKDQEKYLFTEISDDEIEALFAD